MKKGIWLVVAVAFTIAALVGCGGDSDDSGQPAETMESTPTSEATLAPTTEPTAEATAVPTLEPTPDTISDVDDEADTMEDCPSGGMLQDAAAISACNSEAMIGISSFSFDAKINLMAIFSADSADSEEGAINLSGDFVLPDSLSFKLSIAAEGETVEMSALTIGSDAYFMDPESGQWFKGSPPDSESLAMVQMVGMLYLPNDAGATLKEVIDVDDGTKAYVLASDQEGQQTGMEGFGFPGSSLTRVVGADDFLTREVRVGVEGMGGEIGDIVTIRYYNFDEPLVVEPPAEYMEIPDEWMDTGTTDALTVLGLAKNAEGDIEVQFSEPVFVQGEVGLYVLDPQTGGWELPLLGGSGTDTLTFDSDPEGAQALVVGESQIAGITFPSQDSQIANADGARPILDFEPWTYE